jgi:hypothetical protein
MCQDFTLHHDIAMITAHVAGNGSHYGVKQHRGSGNLDNSIGGALQGWQSKDLWLESQSSWYNWASMATTLSDMHNAEEHDEEGSLKAGNIIF